MGVTEKRVGVTNAGSSGREARAFTSKPASTVRMVKTAIVILAGTESHSDLGRLVNGLQAAKEFQDEGDEIEVIFDGAGTQWIPELEDEDHDYHALYDALSENVTACDYCADAFQVGGEVDDSEADRVAEFEGHPSVRDLVAEEYEVVTY
jgi:hypothetical protein